MEQPQWMKFESGAYSAEIYDCFLAHEWGTSPKLKTHKKVIEIAASLRRLKLKVWIDDTNMKKDVATDIINGIKQSRTIVVFITKRYIERCEDGNTDCAKEFINAIFQKGVEKIIPVALDSALLNPQTWKEYSFGYHLRNPLVIDFSTDTKIKNNLHKLHDRIINTGEVDRSANKKRRSEEIDEKTTTVATAFTSKALIWFRSMWN